MTIKIKLSDHQIDRIRCAISYAEAHPEFQKLGVVKDILSNDVAIQGDILRQVNADADQEPI
jgi:hypothetical protein